jgi:hypothetical protein
MRFGSTVDWGSCVAWLRFLLLLFFLLLLVLHLLSLLLLLLSFANKVHQGCGYCKAAQELLQALYERGEGQAHGLDTCITGKLPEKELQ